MLVLSDDEREALIKGESMLPVGITPYYMSLLDREDPQQPLRRTVVPVTGEFLRTPGEADDPLAVEQSPGGELGLDQLPGRGAELELDDFDQRARKFLEASGAKISRPSVLADIARLRLEDAKAHPAGADRQLSDAQLTSVLKPLFVARGLAPARPETYELIAAAWLAAETKPRPEHFTALTEGLKLFPRHAGLIFNTASLYHRIGNSTAAGALADHGEKISTTDDDRSRFARLKASFSPSS